jgi:hypothetical protein
MTAQNVIYIILATLSLISVVCWLVARLTGRTPCTLIGRQGVRLTMERPGYALYWSPTDHLQVHLNPIGWVLFTWRRQGNGQQIGLWFLMLYLSHD